MTLLERISVLRAEHGKISINRLEKEAGVTRGSIAKWDDHAPSYDKLKRVADYFGVTVDYLLHGDDAENAEKPSTISGELSLGMPNGYEQLTPANQAIVDRLIADLVKSQLDS